MVTWDDYNKKPNKTTTKVVPSIAKPKNLSTSNNFWTGPVGNALVNYQKNVVEKGNIVPTFDTSKGNALSKGAKFLANLPLGIVNAVAGKAAMAPAYDITGAISDRTKGVPTDYNKFVSPSMKLGAQIGGKINPESGKSANVKQNVEEWVGNAAGTAEGPVTAALLGPASYLSGPALEKKLVEDAAKAAALKATPVLNRMWQGSKAGGKVMAPFGFLSGLEQNKDKKLPEQVLRSAGSAAAAGAGGMVIGAAVPPISDVLSKAGSGLKSLFKGKNELRSGNTPEAVASIAQTPEVPATTDIKPNILNVEERPISERHLTNPNLTDLGKKQAGAIQGNEIVIQVDKPLDKAGLDKLRTYVDSKLPKFNLGLKEKSVGASNFFTQKVQPDGTAEIYFDMNTATKIAQKDGVNIDYNKAFVEAVGGNSGKTALGATPAVMNETVPPAIEGQAVSPVDQAIAEINRVKPIRGQQEAIYSAERGKRFGAFKEAGINNTGEAGAQKQLATLGGEMPKVGFEPLQISQGSRDELFKMAQLSDKLGTEGERATVIGGLNKLFGKSGGAVPNDSELALMEKVYGSPFVEAVLTKRPMLQKIAAGVMNVLNVPKSAMASGDLSGTLRQGAILVVNHPITAAKAFVEELKYFVNPKYFNEAQTAMINDPLYAFSKKAGLPITEPSSAIVGSGEEAFASSNLTGKIPFFGKLVAASDRAYTGFLNKMRFDVFKSVVTKNNLTENIDEAKGFADFIANATGRANLGELEGQAKWLNTIFFAPRLALSRFNLMDPLYYTSLPPLARKEAIKSMAIFAGTILTTLQLAKLAGAEVSMDCTSADGGKIKIKNTRIDIGAGFMQPIRLACQLISQKTTSSTTGKSTKLGEKFGSSTGLDLVYRYIEGKEAPVPSLVTALLRNKDFLGEKLNIPAEVIQRLIPMTIQDGYDLYKDDPALLPLLIFTILGTGTQTYGSTKAGRGTYY